MTVHQLDERRPPCVCMPWAQAWLADRPEICCRCGGRFPRRTIPARRVRPGEVIPLERKR